MLGLCCHLVSTAAGTAWHEAGSGSSRGKGDGRQERGRAICCRGTTHPPHLWWSSDHLWLPQLPQGKEQTEEGPGLPLRAKGCRLPPCYLGQGNGLEVIQESCAWQLLLFMKHR